MSIVEKAAEKLKALQQLGLQASPPVESESPHPTPAIERLQERVRSGDQGGETESPPWHIDHMALKRAGLLAVDEKANDRLADEVRRIKRPLMRNAMGKGVEAPVNAARIMVTSAVPGEGKTFTAVNLALSLAREPDFEVLLVDGDIPKAHVTRVLGLEKHPGLMDVLVDERRHPDEVVVRTDISNLLVVPVGDRHRLTAELFGSLRMDYALEELGGRNRRRLVVFDSSPLLATSEAQVLASHMGQVVVVVAAGRTGQHLVNAALERLDNAQYVGLILNMSRLPASENHYDNYYGQYARLSQGEA
ncbi:MAG: exopolysaccharide biosynthesis protein [Rhodanobacter sp.]|nr:MAG: exopolysaccharide biosynthesis protein [Rhodanobacter sp.]TAL90118.1 MAG: exopolysaccharide biosynthesis protein [Rhodanobacter sp.]TAM40902.1 MAG: exopolysaccharide biosynthesis protein [Rhodanobacter sp.]TAN25698.1 MAG: exopolysaccharide biosynthesis protein [Rhodanobacter sp.]